MESGEWRVESGEWRVESGEWRVESGEWRVESTSAQACGASRYVPAASRCVTVPKSIGRAIRVWYSCRWGGEPKIQRVETKNVKRFRGGLVFEAHRLLYHSTLGLRVIKKKSRCVTVPRSIGHAIRVCYSCRGRRGASLSSDTVSYIYIYMYIYIYIHILKRFKAIHPEAGQSHSRIS